MLVKGTAAENVFHAVDARIDGNVAGVADRMAGAVWRLSSMIETDKAALYHCNRTPIWVHHGREVGHTTF